MRLPDSSVGGVRRAVPDSERALPLGSSFRWPGTTTNCPSLGDFVRGESLSDMQPTHRIAEPEDIAQAALWLASEDSGFVNGHALAVDGGLMAARPHADLGRRMAKALESADD